MYSTPQMTSTNLHFSRKLQHLHISVHSFHLLPVSEINVPPLARRSCTRTADRQYTVPIEHRLPICQELGNLQIWRERR